MIQVTFLTNNAKVASAPENSNLLRVSLREQGGIPFKCGGGLCGTCKCRIEQGLEHTDAIPPQLWRDRKTACYCAGASGEGVAASACGAAARRSASGTQDTLTSPLRKVWQAMR